MQTAILEKYYGLPGSIGRTNDAGACLTLVYLKTARQLTLTVITALFVVTAAFLWTSASAKASATNHAAPLPSRQGRPPASNVRGSIGFPRRFISSALARIRYRNFWSVVSARVHSLWATWMEMETSTFWSATAFLARRAFPF